MLQLIVREKSNDEGVGKITNILEKIAPDFWNFLEPEKWKQVQNYRNPQKKKRPFLTFLVQASEQAVSEMCISIPTSLEASLTNDNNNYKHFWANCIWLVNILTVDFLIEKYR